MNAAHSKTKVVEDCGYFRVECSCGWWSNGKWSNIEGANAAARFHAEGSDPERWFL